jgi:DNA-binding transcriptional regulator YhcF (GntR family)
MLISLTKDSDVPLRQQLAEQILFLITTGQMRTGEEMPSVRALARRLHVHHNTVSAAYQDLVRRDWLTRRPGSRLIVGARANGRAEPSTLDELINESIRRAKELGFPLQALQRRVRERLLAEPADHVLVVEDEEGLRAILRKEVIDKLGWTVEGCSWQELRSEPALAIGAQVLAPNHIAEDLKQLVPAHRPAIPVAYSRADEHLETIRNLKQPSIVAVASISESLLKTARSLFAPAIGRKHVFREIPTSGDKRMKVDGVDLVFCDSAVISLVTCRRKVHYQLIPSRCLDDLAAALDPSS